MANNYLRDPKTPFFSVEDDVDDETFLRSAPPRYPTSSNYGVTDHYQNYDNEMERKHQELIQRRKEIEERTIQSSVRSLRTLHDTEDIGIAAAEELVKQREQLERTDRRLDDINNTLRFSQKHIQGIKSVFGGLRNYFSGSKSMELPPGSSGSGLKSPTSPMSPTSNSSLAEKLNSSAEATRRNSDHPSLRIRGLTEEEEEMENFKHSHIRNTAAVLERNLDEMSGSIAKLKNLAIGLSEEIDTQNDIIDTITDKAERADLTVQRQNKDIRHLLKK